MSSDIKAATIATIVIALVGGLYTCYSFYVLVQEAKRVSSFRSNWTKVSGRVKEYTVAGCTQEDSTAGFNSFPFSKHKCSVKVEYTLDGQAHVEDIETFTYDSQAFKPGEEITVYVNPENPKEIEYRDYTLVAWRITSSILLILFMLILSIGGVYVWKIKSNPQKTNKEGVTSVSKQ